MAGDSLLYALKKLEADTVKDRAAGLADLRSILNQTQPTTKIHEVRDYGWHKILDTLFALVKGDKHDFLSGSATARKRAASRLETTSQALRLVVGFCTPYLRHKTAYAVLDHIKDTLDFEKSNEDSFRALVVGEYLKVAHLILANESHGEHLRVKDWERYTDFALTAINAALADPEIAADEDQDENITASRDFSFGASARSILPARPSQYSSNSRSRRPAARPLDDLITCLMNLTSISNSPLVSRLSQISQTVLSALSAPLLVKDAAFKCLNNVLLVALTEDTALVSHVTAQAVVVIKHLWLRTNKDDNKYKRLREQMLTMLLLVRRYLHRDVVARTNIDLAAVDALAYTIRDEYENRGDQNCLQISDLVFSQTERDDVFQRVGIAPNLGSQSATLHWTTVSMVATLRAVCRHQFVSREEEDGSVAVSRKRQKRSVPFADLVCWLLLDKESIDFSCFLDHSETLLGETSDDQATRSSWALLVLARLSNTSFAQEKLLQDYWIRVWKAASRLITSPLNSRAACFTMMTLLCGGHVDALLSQSNLIDYCFQGGTRGPPTLTDSALLLFTSCLRSSSLNTDRQFNLFRDKVLSWLDTSWILPSSRDHAVNVEVAQMGQPVLLFDLFRALGGMARVEGQKHWIYQPPAIYQSYLQSKDNDAFAAFIIKPTSKKTVDVVLSDHRKDDKTQSSRLAKQSRMALSDFILRKLESFRQSFRKLELADARKGAGGRSESKQFANLGIEIAEILSTASAVAALVVAPTTTEDVIFQCWQCVYDFILMHNSDAISFENCCLRVAQRVVEVWPTAESDHFEAAQRRLKIVASLRHLISNHDTNYALDNDMDTEFVSQPANSQPSQNKSQNFERDVSRQDVPFSTSIHGLFVETELLLLHESFETDLSNRSRLASAMIDHVISLPPDDLLASRVPFLEYLREKNALSVIDASRLLRHVAQIYLEADEFERNEAALCYCLKIMTSLAHLWVYTENEELSDISFDIYSWFIDTALSKGIASNRVLYNLSELLDHLFRTHSRYGADSLPSPRTSLLQILKKGLSILKFKIVPSLTNLFEGYVLTEHAAVFDDIVDHLPTEPDDREGIAVRLYILAKLGSRWKTTLRQALYHIFETVANVPTATSVAQSSLKIIASEVGIGDSPSRLLHLFCTQIFYTWLEEGTLGTIPFSAFGYQTLQDLARAEQEELTAQAVLRQSSTHKRALEDLLRQLWPKILEENFARAQVYAIATDVVDNRAGPETGPIENSVKDELGVDVYADLAIQHLAETVAIVIISISDDRGIDKLFASSSRYKSMATIFDSIRNKGHSSMAYPPRQQPSFRAKYLIHILTKLCQIVGISPDSLWTPALLIYVCRKILDDADPALGPLHVASAIRKIRIAITLAGPVALEGFPLEMLLREMMPFLTRFHCSEDTVGIVWYLFEHGSDHLETNLPFFAGLGVSILTSLSTFITSPQESTTQESQFIATMSKAKDLRTWLGSYLSNARTAHINELEAERLHAIFQNATNVTEPGTNDRNAPEGRLLYHLLQDQSTNQPLIARKFFELIIRSLSRDFRVCDEASEDILTTEDDIVASVPTLWHLVVDGKVSGPFETWVGKILGKAYTASGPSLKLADSQESDDSSSLDQHNSIRAIVGTLANMLWQEYVASAGMAEGTLSNVLSTIPKTERQALLASSKHWSNFEDLVFESIPRPPLHSLETLTMDLGACLEFEEFADQQHWASAVAELIIQQNTSDSFLVGLVPLLRMNASFGENALPMIAHLVLDAQVDGEQTARELLSELFNTIFRSPSARSGPFCAVALKVVLYLRRWMYPRETNFAARNNWIDIDFGMAAKAALDSKMPQVALMMLEIGKSEQDLQITSRRSSIRATQTNFTLDSTLLPDIFQRVEDEDFFYGSHHESNITSVLAKLRHENQSNRVLALQSALFDSAIKSNGLEPAIKQQGDGIVAALSLANLHGLAYATQQYALNSSERMPFDDSLLNIHQWDVPIPAGSPGHGSALQTVLQRVDNFQSKKDVQSGINSAVSHVVSGLTHQTAARRLPASQLLGLATLTAVEQLLNTSSHEGLSEVWAQNMRPLDWMVRESFSTVSEIFMAREATCAAMRRHDRGSELFGSSRVELLLSEIRSVRSSLALANRHDATQFCLNRAAYLSELHQMARDLKLDVDDAVSYDIANTLWSQGEVTAPIEILQSIEIGKAGDEAALPISKSEILTDLGQKLSQARLRRPDEITKHYLQPAIGALEKKVNGAMAGRVYHNFAAFCDEQLRDSVAKDDFERISKIRNRKHQDVNELAELCKKSTGRERESFKMAYSKAKTWFKLDDEEYRRLKANREVLLRNCLENYLLSIHSCDEHDKDVLRFLSLWLGNPQVQAEESAIREYLRMVPSLKLAPFVNQLSSRLADNGDPFQRTLFEMFFRICRDHPFHSLYQLFSVFKSKGAKEDEAAKSRQKAADRLAKLIQSPEGKTSSQTWISVHNSNITFVNFAQERSDKATKAGKEIPMRNFVYGKKLEQTIQGLSKKIPPPTMTIALRRDKDYTTLPTFSTFEPNICVAGGISAPKITTIVASDGTRHKMLLKGGNDDLRQDAIMEQVFEQVSDLLQDHRATRQRKLGIRTYKVIPLTHNAGIIEFVRNTIPLHEYLLPAHVRYYPKDYKPNVCKQHIANAQTKSNRERIRVFENVIAHFHPVMRFFFMEHFLDPDDWFNKRLAYSRTTAAISILGHVLGLGDRHGHNILLDEQTGEVVHIDLGVAFEAGRILPVPEVVPFRLTRDLVDGMGLSGVEGPFRRCCQFTLEALRKNQDVIMTILDVLRWDPLYSWSVSPLRIQRMQDAQEREAAAAAAAASTTTRDETPLADDKPQPPSTPASTKKKDPDGENANNANNANDEPGEADRALSIVAKKLSAGLSVEATVNELIRQATDVDNLAVLYCGWAAYA